MIKISGESALKCLPFVYKGIQFGFSSCTKIEADIPWVDDPSDLWCAVETDNQLNPLQRDKCDDPGNSSINFLKV